MRLLCLWVAVVPLAPTLAAPPTVETIEDQLQRKCATELAVRCKSERQLIAQTVAVSLLPGVGWMVYPRASLQLRISLAQAVRLCFVGKKQRLARLKRHYATQYEKRLHEALGLRQRLVQHAQLYESRLQLLSLWKKRFAIWQEAYDKGELLPTEFLSKEIAFETHRLSVVQARLDYEKLYQALEQLLTLQIGTYAAHPNSGLAQPTG